MSNEQESIASLADQLLRTRIRLHSSSKVNQEEETKDQKDHSPNDNAGGGDEGKGGIGSGAGRTSGRSPGHTDSGKRDNAVQKKANEQKQKRQKKRQDAKKNAKAEAEAAYDALSSDVKKLIEKAPNGKDDWIRKHMGNQ